MVGQFTDTKGRAMYRHYRSRRTTDEDLDRMAAEANAAEEICAITPRFVIADRGPFEEAAIHLAIEHVLDYMAEESRDEHGRDLRGSDLLRAVEAWELILGSVVRSPRDEYRIVELDYRVCVDAVALAVLADLPAWIAIRYQKLLCAQLGERVLSMRGSN